MKTVQGEIRELERQVAEMEGKIEAMQRRDKAARDEAERKHQEDVEVLQRMKNCSDDCST